MREIKREREYVLEDIDRPFPFYHQFKASMCSLVCQTAMFHTLCSLSTKVRVNACVHRVGPRSDSIMCVIVRT